MVLSPGEDCDTCHASAAELVAKIAKVSTKDIMQWRSVHKIAFLYYIDYYYYFFYIRFQNREHLQVKNWKTNCNWCMNISADKYEKL